ncbi:esterase family protein, partial [Rhodococcus cerastii]|nr:esterase family protein [Rhodococcus cerastii]
MRRNALTQGSAAVGVALSLLISPAVAWAGGGTSGAHTPPASDASGAHLVSKANTTDRRVNISVFSPSMGRDIPLEVILPADGSEPRPTLYLLNGAGG